MDRAAAPTRRLVVGAVVVNDPSHPTRVLACRRHRPAELAGRWEFPGGKTENFEQPEGALSRELIEELNLHARVGEEFRSATGSWPIDDTYELRLFWCATAGRAVPGDTHDEVRWVGPEELRQLPWVPADQAPALELADRMIEVSTRPRWHDVLEADDVTLRPLEISDADRLAPLFADPESVRYLGHGVMNLQQTRLHIAGRIAANERGERLSFVVEHHGNLVGTAHISLKPVHASIGLTGEWQGDIGYALLPAEQGAGIGTRTAHTLLALAFGQLGLRRITAMVFEGAEASHRIMRRLGMREEGRFLEASLGEDGTWFTDVAYAMLREEWLERTGE